MLLQAPPDAAHGSRRRGPVCLHHPVPQTPARIPSTISMSQHLLSSFSASPAPGTKQADRAIPKICCCWSARNALPQATAELLQTPTCASRDLCASLRIKTLEAVQLRSCEMLCSLVCELLARHWPLASQKCGPVRSTTPLISDPQSTFRPSEESLTGRARPGQPLTAFAGGGHSPRPSGTHAQRSHPACKQMLLLQQRPQQQPSSAQQLQTCQIASPSSRRQCLFF
jgi:hypothetical protein